jgi:hypothetical protein
MCYADTYSLLYKPLDGGMSAVVQDQSAIRTLWGKLSELYHASTLAGDNAAQYWADIQAASVKVVDASSFKLLMPLGAPCLVG